MRHQSPEELMLWGLAQKWPLAIARCAFCGHSWVSMSRSPAVPPNMDKPAVCAECGVTSVPLVLLRDQAARDYLQQVAQEVLPTEMEAAQRNALTSFHLLQLFQQFSQAAEGWRKVTPEEEVACPSSPST